MQKRLEAIWKQIQSENQLNGISTTGCGDCAAVCSPLWVSLPLGIFICFNCAGAHRRTIGSPYSLVRSVSFDTWSESQVAIVENNGNIVVNREYEMYLDPKQRPTPDSTWEDRTEFIVAKYEKRKYFGKYLAPTIPNLPKRELVFRTPTDVRVNHK